MRAIALALPLLPGKESDLQSLARDLKSRGAEYEELLRQKGIAREAAFLQRTPQGSYVIIYRELDESHSTPSRSEGELDSSLRERIASLHGFDPAAAPPSKVELLVRQRPSRGRNL